MNREISLPGRITRVGSAVRTVLLVAVVAAYAPAAGATGSDWTESGFHQSGQEETQPRDEPRDLEIRALNDEIQRLREQVRELMDRLSAAQEEIVSLRQQLASAESPSEEADSSASSEFDELSIPEDQPLASPDAALLALQASYEKQVNPESLATERERADVLRRVRRWMPRANREFTGPVEWACEIRAIERLRTGAVYLTVVVIDPVTGAARSRPHVVEISKRIASGLDRIPRDEPALLGGVFRLDLVLNEDREEPGLFNDPALVGPFVEFGFEIVVRSISSVPPEMTQPADGNPSPGG